MREQETDEWRNNLITSWCIMKDLTDCTITITVNNPKKVEVI